MTLPVYERLIKVYEDIFSQQKLLITLLEPEEMGDKINGLLLNAIL